MFRCCGESRRLAQVSRNQININSRKLLECSNAVAKAADSPKFSRI